MSTKTFLLSLYIISAMPSIMSMSHDPSTLSARLLNENPHQQAWDTLDRAQRLHNALLHARMSNDEIQISAIQSEVPALLQSAGNALLRLDDSCVIGVRIAQAALACAMQIRTTPDRPHTPPLLSPPIYESDDDR